jgi:hypothetical protein
MKKVLLFILLLSPLYSFAQGWLSLSGTVAENYITDIHGNMELLGGYEYKNFSANTGASLIFTHSQTRVEAFQVQAAYLFNIPYVSIELKTGYLLLPHTNTIFKEHIWHLQAMLKHPHIEISIGYLIRTYAAKNTQYSEFNDFIYCVQAYAWKKGNPYNIDLAISNYNDLYIERSINPHIRLRGSYSYPKYLTYFIEGLYGGSGVGNVYFEQFQWRIKLGIVWNISDTF